jgi:3-phenylpropionate/trans-cinnamate dioxygenase ferredoxin reductase component
MPTTTHPIVIIGNGISGATAAIEIRKRSSQPIILISEEAPVFFSRPALMYVHLGQLRAQDIEVYPVSFWENKKIKRLQTRVISIDPKVKSITTDGSVTIFYERLILATGSKPRLPGLENQDAQGVFTFYSWQDLQLIENASPSYGSVGHSQKVIIAGGGLIGIELAEMLQARGMHVTMIIKDAHYWASQIDVLESTLIAHQCHLHGIDLLFETLIDRIDQHDHAVHQIHLSNGQTLPCTMLCFAIGVEPHITLAAAAGIECQRGIMVDDRLETSAAGIYAIGDCAQIRQPQKGRNPIEPVWYTGKIMGETVARNIVGGQEKYQPGIWFNSAKFFHLEYQTYGYVPPNTNALCTSFFWQSTDQMHAVKCVFSKDRNDILGISGWGIRIKHAFAQRMLSERWNMDEVMSELDQLLFNEEGALRYAFAIRESYFSTSFANTEPS